MLLRNHEFLPAKVSDALAQEAKSAAEAALLESLRGHEGQAAAIYFEHFGGMLPDEFAKLFETNGRQRRPAPDPVNACLSFAYSMLTHECTASLRTARLEPSIGAFHVSRPGRPALALDLMEPFRPLIADSLTITAFQKGELKPGHFTQTAAGCLFSDAGRKAFFTAFCVLKPIDRVRLQTELEEQMNQREDQVVIIDLGENETTARTATTVLGQSLSEPLQGMVVI